MTRATTRLATALVLAFSFSAPAALACINDREVEDSEHEFRSRYGEKQEAREEPIQLGLAPVGALGVIALGGALYLAGRRRAT